MSFCCFFFLLLPSHSYFSFLFSSPFLVLPPFHLRPPNLSAPSLSFLKTWGGNHVVSGPYVPHHVPHFFFFFFLFLGLSSSLIRISYPPHSFFLFFFLSPLSFFVSFSLLFIYFFFLLFPILLTSLLKTRFLAPQKKLQLPPCFNVLSIKTWVSGSHHVFIFYFFDSIFFIFFIYFFIF